ncbi:MAG: hypothetical protein CYPHOPRED_001547 [Cyphobasidiales sp. Tagirdzhanova-0007]|nr:MAG: hypothetical protein CYPHOPRED_001547 [Cyphobasidiales sp. Tagirdzhanova-0007]
MPTSKPAHLEKMFVVPKVAETISQSSLFRKVAWTGEHSQLVQMTIPAGGEIGEEVHHVDQTLMFTSGTARAIVSGEEREVGAGDIVIVPAGCKHNFVTTSKTPLILFTVYAPAEHYHKTEHKTKDQGDKLEEDGKDEPPAWAQPSAKQE